MLQQQRYKPFRRLLAPALVLSLAPFAFAQDTAGLLGPETDPVVEAIVATPRKAPADFARAVFTLADIGEVERAKPILKQLIDQQLDEAGLAALVEQFGSAKFFRLASSPAFGPDERDFAQRCMAAAGKRARDPQRLAVIIERLLSDDQRANFAAMVDLRTTGLAGVEALITELPKGEIDRQNRIRRALVALAPLSTPVLIAALNAEDLVLVTQASIAMAEIGEDQAVAQLAALATIAPPDSPVGQAAAWSYTQLAGQPLGFEQFLPVTNRGIDRYLEGGPAFPPDAAGNVPLGVWDADAKKVVTARVPAAEAGVVLAARIAAAQAVALGDRDALVRRAMVLRIESRAIRSRHGLPIAATDPTADASPNQLTAALSEALREGRHVAAVTLCDTLAKQGDVGVLSSFDGRATPLAKALDAPHPAVRFAALRAIMQLNPPGPFPGSSRVVPTLEHFAAGEGDTIAVVGTPNLQRSATLGGRLNGAGMRSLVTNRGCEVVELADRGADVSLAFVDMAILDPPVRETVFRLRRQVASAGLPIVLLAGDGRLADAEKIAKEHRRVIAMPRPHTNEDAASLAAEAIALLLSDWPSIVTRAKQAEQARAWIAELQADGPAFYRLPRLPRAEPTTSPDVISLPPAPGSVGGSP